MLKTLGKASLRVSEGIGSELLTSRPVVVRTLSQVLGPIITVPYMPGCYSSSHRPVLTAITIDTEPGYVDRLGRRMWLTQAPEAYGGYTIGIRHWLEFARQARVSLTFLLCTQCFAAEGPVLVEVVRQLETVLAEGHELGLHLHPSEDAALQQALGRNLSYGRAGNYSSGEIEEMLSASRQLVRLFLGTDAAERIKSFRWGNWSLHTTAVKALENQGFLVDSSACPGMAGHLSDEWSDRAYDWRRVRTQSPWYLHPLDYQRVGGVTSGVLEIPVSVFSAGPYRFRASPALGPLLLAASLRFCKVADPESHVLVILSHSSEATRDNGDPVPLLAGLSATVDKLRSERHVAFVTLSAAGEQIRAKVLRNKREVSR